MSKLFWTSGITILGGLAGYLMTTERKPEGIIVFVVIVVLNASKVFK